MDPRPCTFAAESRFRKGNSSARPIRTGSYDFGWSAGRAERERAAHPDQSATQQLRAAPWRPAPDRRATPHREPSSSMISKTPCSTARERMMSMPSSSASSITSATHSRTCSAVSGFQVRTSSRANVDREVGAVICHHLLDSAGLESTYWNPRSRADIENMIRGIQFLERLDEDLDQQQFVLTRDGRLWIARGLQARSRNSRLDSNSDRQP